MAKNAKPKRVSKAAVRAAADRAQARSDATKAAAAAPAPAPGGTSNVRMIAKTALTTLMTQVLKYQNDVSTAAGNIGDLVRDYATNKNLHRGAFSDIKKLYRMGKKDPGKLWLHLAHFDDMRIKLGLDELAGAQEQMLPPGTENESEEESDAGTGDDKVSRPHFGAAHPAHADSDNTDVRPRNLRQPDAGSDAVKDIATKAGAQPSTH